MTPVRFHRDQSKIASEFAGPDPQMQTLLEGWQKTGRSLVTEHHAELTALIAKTELEFQKRHYSAASSMAQLAANHAVLWHPGQFASAALDEVLIRLGSTALPTAGSGSNRRCGRLHVLHIATQMGGIGGHVRMLWRWISEDSENHHSVAMTRQTRPLPGPLLRAVRQSGGTVHYANRQVGGLLSWARALQSAFAGKDLIVLHVHNQDIIPFLALAGMRERPPVVLLNHADHVLWVGAGMVEAVVSTRRSGADLCVARRGIPADRNFVLPLCLERAPRRLTRSEAKYRIGLPKDSVMILTIARAVKFRPIDGLGFADAFVPLLKCDRRRHLVVIGPLGTVDWSAAEAQVPGQIIVMAERADTATFYEAADIYVDSFPFPSITSLLEAGLREVPLITRYPYGLGCEIMGADSVGIDDVLVRTRRLSEFRETLHALLADSGGRHDLGRRTRASIEATNLGPAWRQHLRALYDDVLCLPCRSAKVMNADGPQFQNVDLFSPYVFGTVLSAPSPVRRLAHSREIGFKTMPPLQRLSVWSGMTFRSGFAYRRHMSAWSYLVPEWLSARLRVRPS